MQAENLILHHRCQWEVVEQVCEVLPDVGVAVLAQALVIEAIHLSDLTTLVISTKDSDALLEAHLEANEEGDGLDGVVATINVVAHEEIVCVWRVASNLEQFHQVVELAVHVSAHGHGASYWLHVVLRLQYFFRLRVKPSK